MGRITSHVLDLSAGKPVIGLDAQLYKKNNEEWISIGKDRTNNDGRMCALLDNKPLEEGFYKLQFESGKYFSQMNLDTFYPQIKIEFQIKDAQQNYHIPLLLSQFGYTTYRGS